MLHSLLKTFRTQFRFKVFFIFAVCGACLSCTFILFFISHQSKSLKAGIINDGKLLADVLAHNARIGVFSGNKKLLREVIADILQRPGVVEASLYAPDGTRLAMIERPGRHSGRKSDDGSGPTGKEFMSLPHVREIGDMFEFWAPVTADADSSERENLYGEAPPEQDNAAVIGSARLLVDTAPLKVQLRSLLYTSILIGALCLLGCFSLVYLLARLVTEPLRRLTDAVKSLGTGDIAEQVPVEAEDEIGNLARAFNSMTSSLITRERQLHESEFRLRQLSAQVLTAQDEERRRLARELHDDLGQCLALLKIRICSLEQKLHVDQEALKNDCRETDLYIEQIIDNIRRLSKDLSPAVLDDLGLTEALKILFREGAYRHNLDLTEVFADIDDLLPPDGQINLYRFCQEALTNIQKHARADKISVVIEYQNNYITVDIKDNGRGFDAVRLSTPGDQARRGMGLTTLEERAAMLKGDLTLRSNLGEGTRLTLRFPATRE